MEDNHYKELNELIDRFPFLVVRAFDTIIDLQKSWVEYDLEDLIIEDFDEKNNKLRKFELAYLRCAAPWFYWTNYSTIYHIDCWWYNAIGLSLEELLINIKKKLWHKK